MKTTISTRGQVVVPGPIRRRLGLQPGDSLEAKLAGESIVLTPRRTRTPKSRIVKDPITGLPVLKSGTNGVTLTSKQVLEILADFP